MNNYAIPDLPVICGFHPPPESCDAFNERLVRKFGRNDFGGPLFDCVWGGEATTVYAEQEMLAYSHKMVERDLAWEVIEHVADADGVLRETRKLVPLETGPEEYPAGRLFRALVDVGVARFIVREWIHPDVACDGWERERWQWSQKDGRHVDLLGAPPATGTYKALLTVEDKLGNYVAPGDPEIDEIEARVLRRELDPFYTKYHQSEAMPKNLFEDKVSQKLKQIQRNRQAENATRLAEIESTIRDGMATRITPRRHR
jgi:hypothetical protein